MLSVGPAKETVVVRNKVLVAVFKLNSEVLNMELILPFGFWCVFLVLLMRSESRVCFFA